MRWDAKGTMAAAIVAIIVAALTSGCASPANSAAMVPNDIKIEKTHPYSVKIEVRGGRATNAMTDASQISNEAFAKAIADAVIKSRLFTGATQAQSGNYLLRVEILSVEQPTFGLNMTTRLEAVWELVNTGTKQPALRESIVSSHTATTGDSIVGVTRCRLATEGAARKNIEQGLSKISFLTLN